MIKGNKEKREGFAKACDTLAVSSNIGAVVGITGHSQLQVLEIWCLIAAAMALFRAAFLVRR